MNRPLFACCSLVLLLVLACKSVPQGGSDQTTRLYEMMNGSFS